MLGSTAARLRSSSRGLTGRGLTGRVLLGGGLALGAAGSVIAATAAAGQHVAADPATVPTAPVTAAPPPTTTTPTVFTGPADASNTALGVVAAFTERAIGMAVTDPACSRPASAAAGEQFVCYATKPGPALVSLRVTIGEGRQLSFAVEVNQPSPAELEQVATTATEQ